MKYVVCLGLCLFGCAGADGSPLFDPAQSVVPAPVVDQDTAPPQEQTDAGADTQTGVLTCQGQDCNQCWPNCPNGSNPGVVNNPTTVKPPPGDTHQ